MNISTDFPDNMEPVIECSMGRVCESCPHAPFCPVRGDMSDWNGKHVQTFINTLTIFGSSQDTLRLRIEEGNK